MKRFFLIPMLLALGLLAGCPATTHPVIVTKGIFPPDNLLQDCQVDAPPSKQAYNAAGEGVSREEAFDKREKMLADFGGKQTKNITNCNVDKKGLRDWKVKQQAIYEQELKDAEAKSKKKD